MANSPSPLQVGRPAESAPERPSMKRRQLIGAVAGALVVALGGGTYVLASEDEARRAGNRPDGKPRVPPNQHLLKALRPMGGAEGDPSPGAWRLRVSGEVEQPFEMTFADLIAMPQVQQTCDVHCVTKWTVLDSHWTGVRVADIAAKAKVKANARHVIFEAAEGYTANILLREALAPNVLLAHRYEGNPLPRPHGPPVRALVPDLYFWKSAKWLTGIRFTAADQPGFWETRGYNNHADPWNEERYS
jgi:DMSO/TMAO reductase YedYZ molybdopterin-dependent catalytic subunit